MDIGKTAFEKHLFGYNCAQCVLSSLKEYTGLDDETALAIAAGFGGGLRSGEVCGAISGGVMALGTAFPFTDPKDSEAKQNIALMSKELVAKAAAKFGAVRCAELKSDGVSCSELISELAKMTEEMIKNGKVI